MNPSTIIALVQNDLYQRELKGISKYNTTVDRTDLTEEQWLQHAYEEALDLAVYLKKTLHEKSVEKIKEIEEPTEQPKFKVGDKVKIICPYSLYEETIFDIKEVSALGLNIFRYLSDWGVRYRESALQLIEESQTK